MSEEDNLISIQQLLSHIVRTEIWAKRFNHETETFINFNIILKTYDNRIILYLTMYMVYWNLYIRAYPIFQLMDISIIICNDFTHFAISI